MLKLIENKRYNTETAEEIYSYWNGLGCSDFRYRVKKLYRTKKGAWFLYHEGGAMTDMSVNVGDGRGGSEDIEVIDDDDAFGFLQAHSAESEAMAAIDKYFADRIEEA